MNGGFAGSFDPRERHPAAGPLRLEKGSTGGFSPICLLDGFVDPEPLLADLGLAPDQAPGGVEGLLGLGYRRWGTGLLARLRGEFSLLVWDTERLAGLIARDQIGVHPLYLSERMGSLLFATDIPSLQAMLGSRAAPDRVALAHWLAAASAPGDRTLFEGIRRLGPGEATLIDRDGWRRHRYWEPRFEEPIADVSRLASETRERLGRAVDRRLATESRSGVLLSGGLDSSSIAALGVGLSGGDLYACSGVFPEHPAVDESDLIDLLRERLGIDGAIAEVRPGGLLQSAIDYTGACQMPLLGWGDFWLQDLMRWARSAGVGVLLDGTGGDELFGPRAHVLGDCLRAGRLAALRHHLARLPGAGPRVSRRDLAAVVVAFGLEGALPAGLGAWLEASRSLRATPPWLRRSELRTLAPPDAEWRRLDGPRWWAASAYGLSRGIEASGVLEHQHRRSVLTGVWTRNPMLDLDLVQLGLRQAPEATLDPRYNRPVLRRAIGPLLPSAVRERPVKARFDSLLIDCLSGPDAALAQDLLLSPETELRDHLDQDAMRRALFDDRALRASDPFRWMRLLWRHLAAEIWLRFERDPGAASELVASVADVRPAMAASYLFPP
jgi:asparagine synthase (glutamine-hydrolysing)